MPMLCYSFLLQTREWHRALWNICQKIGCNSNPHTRKKGCRRFRKQSLDISFKISQASVNFNSCKNHGFQISLKYLDRFLQAIRFTIKNWIYWIRGKRAWCSTFLTLLGSISKVFSSQLMSRISKSWSLVCFTYIQLTWLTSFQFWHNIHWIFMTKMQ